MAAGGFREFIAGEVLDEDKINDFLMQGILVFADAAARDAAITAPVEGQFAFLKDTDALEFYDGTDFVEFETGPGAVVGSTTGSPVIGTYTDSVLGKSYDRYVFNGVGSITFSKAGFARILAVGGGGGAAGFNSGNTAAGGGGGAVFGSFDVGVDTYTVSVGNGGTGLNGSGEAGSGAGSGVTGVLLATGGNGARARDGFVSNAYNGHGGNSGSAGYSNGDALASGGGGGGLTYGANISAGISFDWTGSNLEYGASWNTSLSTNTNGTANRGQAGRFRGNGGSGRVIVMVEV